MEVHEPTQSHAPLGEADQCAIHGDGLGELPADEPRLWHVRGSIRARWVIPHLGLRFPDGEALHDPSEGMEIPAGTRLRLDGFMAGRFYEGGVHDSVTRRFCVLDGPLAGTCWRHDWMSFIDGGTIDNAAGLIAHGSALEAEAS